MTAIATEAKYGAINCKPSVAPPRSEDAIIPSSIKNGISGILVRAKILEAR